MGVNLAKLLNKFVPVKFVDENEVPYGIKHENNKPSVNIEIGDNASSDAFQRFRVANQRELFDNKNIHDRRPNQWEEPVIGAIIVYSNLASGPFQVAETVTGGSSGSIGTITAVDGGSLTITYTINHNDFQIGEEITGGTSGATADVDSANTGSTISHNRNEASVILQIGQGANDSCARQTHRFFPYTPGKSQQIMLTFLFDTEVTNVRRRCGYFSPDNGLFLEQTSEGLFFVRRTKTSGSIVEHRIHQNNPTLSTDGISTWNVDKFDGTGESGITLDITKDHLLFIDFAWLGTGRVRFGFMVNGRLKCAHNINTLNNEAVPFMSTPSLPVRYEISNTGSTSSTNIMKEFCSTVISEGGDKQTGVGFSVSRGAIARAVTTEVPILAIRLKNTFGTGNGENRRTVQFSNASIFATTNGVHFVIKNIHDPSGIIATWTDVNVHSAVEFSTDITQLVGNPEQKIEQGYADAGQAGKGGQESTISGDKLDQHRVITQNFDSNNSELFVIYATALSGTSNVYAHISWVEFD